MKIVGLLSGHDCSYAVLENGVPIIHNELERFIREKEPPGDALEFFFQQEDIKDIDYFVSGDYQPNRESQKVLKNSKYYSKALSMVDESKIIEIGHHQSHAANAFFSSNFDDALIITMDGGGGAQIFDGTNYTELNQTKFTAFTVWFGEGNKIYPIDTISHEMLNIGTNWRKCTVEIFGLSGGHPYGNQVGTVMAMATNGDPNKYHDQFYNLLSNKSMIDMEYFKNIVCDNEQESFDVSAGLQSATERITREILTKLIEKYDYKNICLSGGVALNCVMTAKINEWFPEIENVFVDAVPHDGGLAIGGARYLWHHILDNPRIKWTDNSMPYLGQVYDIESIRQTIDKFYDDIVLNVVKDEDVINLLDEQKIIAVFGGGSESGRRALGNRSIIADPRSNSMKDLINEKVKHRQWFRPFAPSILREEVSNWFVRDIDSPFMSFALKFRKDKKHLVPAVVHFDDTGRLQTVTQNDNEWYYNFIKKWQSVSGVPILLNTSFNDREPIVETPEHAIKCFLGTNIDGLYFYDHNIYIEKK